jgi:hypothetical protein
MVSSQVVAADVCDKKPELPKCAGTDPEPDPDDACAKFAAPDFAFWRDSVSKRVPAVTVFVADSASGCEKELLRIDLADSGPINKLNLAYSTVGAGETFFGRIVIEREKWLDSSQGESVWKYDFEISGGEIVPIFVNPVMILESNDPENQSFGGIDLSTDTSSLVWHAKEREGQLSYQSISTLNIDECTYWPCTTIDGGTHLVQSVYHVLGTGSSSGTSLRNPVWGPYDERIYYRSDDVYGEFVSQYIMAIRSDGSDSGQGARIFSREDQFLGDPAYRAIRALSSGLSGWPDPGEFLAVEIAEDYFLFTCADVYTINLGNCPSNCELQYETQGNFPSWTKSGKIIHSGLGKSCKLNQIGLWDGAVEALTMGVEPEAAGGVIEVVESG